MVTEFLVGLAQFVGFVLSFGTDSAATGAEDAGKSAVKKLLDGAKNAIKDGFHTLKSIATNGTARSLFMNKLKQTALNKLKDFAVTEVEKKAIGEICGKIGDDLLDKTKAQANPPSSFNINSLDPLHISATKTDCDNISDDNSKIQCAKDIIETVAMVDPTGLASMAAAFMQPVCDV